MNDEMYWTVIGKSERQYYLKCQCKCGTIKDVWASSIKLRKSLSCGCKPRKPQKPDSERRLARVQKYIGTEINGLKINDVLVKSTNSGDCLFFDCLCICGKSFSTRASAVLCGSIKTCGHNRDIELQKGRDLIKSACKDGSNAIMLQSRVNGSLNKNNTTGFNGISKMKDGRYRAYINFKRKQYSLGVYVNILDALEARKLAEKEIYSDFISWYKSKNNSQS